MNSIRIAYINSVAGYGSTGRLVWQLSRMPGIEGRLYYGRHKDLTGTGAYRITSPFGNAVHAAGTFLLDRQGFCNTSETEKLAAELKRFHPDIIHLHNLHGYYLDVNILFQYLKDSGKPVVWTFHDCWPFTGHCAHYDSLDCMKWKKQCFECPGLDRYPITWNGSQVAHNYQLKKELFCSLGSRLTIVTPSHWLEEQVRMSFLKNQKILTIPNGIDPAVFFPQDSDVRSRLHIGDRFLIAACAGSWYREKGLDDIIRMSHELSDKETLVVVGIPERMKHRFGARAVCIPHTQNIAELREIYSAADVLVNPTLEDTFPTVNLEAQACGCPVLTYRTGGSPEMITAKTGAVVAKGDYEAMRRTLDQMRRKELSFDRAECIHHSRQFTSENMCENYMSLYQRIAGEYE